MTYVERVSSFFAHGMLLNILASIGATTEEWGERLVVGCKLEIVATGGVVQERHV